MEEVSVSGNINDKWLNNVYENIKKLEDYERIVREGCSSLMDFMQIPVNSRPAIMGLTQFKTLRFFVTEFRLLIADLTPILNEDKAKAFEKTLITLDKSLQTDKIFIRSVYDLNNSLTETTPTPFFYETINMLHNIKVELFKEIKDILYIKGY